MTEAVQTLVIGAGVVGLAIARRLAAFGDLVVVERETDIGSGTSSRNSEVIHAGMYYPPGSRKARTCVLGRRQLYEWCAAHGVEHQRIGKLIVATDDTQRLKLLDICERSQRNGLLLPDDALQWLEAPQVRELEPDLRGVAALYSPATGIIDTHGLMLSFLADAERQGAQLVRGTRFVGARREGDGFIVRTENMADGESFELRCRWLVNAAGLQAQQAARAIEALPPESIPEPLWLKGNYFGLSGARAPFRHLIYPVPEGGGLGVHLTLDLGGQARFGPDTEAVDPDACRADRPDYRVDPARAEVFYEAIRRYWPGLPDRSLQPAYAGMRPKLAEGGTDLDANDFVIATEATHGLPGLVQLFGIESPGITASMALADEVAQALAP